MNDDGFIETLIGDGRPLLNLSALVLLGSGAFAIFQAATGQFLPHDTAYLGMTADQLCTLRGCRVVHFMIHDRVSFGGVLMALGILYLWLSEFPLKRGERWAWWTLTASAGTGFLSFLAYLGYGYLDTWHGAATLMLLPLFLWSLAKTRKLAVTSMPRQPIRLRSRYGVGHLLLVLATFGIICAGITISTVGMTSVFVPQDLQFMGITPAELEAYNAHLVPLIAHDRAGFGGALASCGVALFLVTLFGAPSRNLWRALALAGLAGFGTAIVIHPIIGYTNLFHLGPAVLGGVAYFVGIAMTYQSSRAKAHATVEPA
jgi:hypothetical protein